MSIQTNNKIDLQDVKQFNDLRKQYNKDKQNLQKRYMKKFIKYFRYKIDTTGV